MSSRALRRAQRERELQTHELQANESGDDSALDELALKPAKTKSSRFAMLGDTEDDDGDDEAEIATALTREESGQVNIAENTEKSRDSNLQDPNFASTAKRKKKKKSRKKAASAATRDNTESSQAKNTDLDDIDLALKSLSVSSKAQEDEKNISTIDPDLFNLSSFLSIDTHHLNVANEMKRLFGRAAVYVDTDDERNTHRPRLLLTERPASLSEAVAGQNSAGGAGLPAILRRRSAFIPGKEDWPRVTNSDLSMEAVKEATSGAVEYRFAHNKSYQKKQEGFEICVRSLDPTMMVDQLRFNPYHISTLLQVSAIAKLEKDYSTSGDLLERALFAFGRAVSSTFSTKLSQGTARLDFRRPENRELWLVIWRYINNITMRATWRTAYEWVKLLLCLDPKNDPYCMRLVVDQYSLRARQAQNFLDLSESAFLRDRWKHLPNIRSSTALAFLQLRDELRAKNALIEAVNSFPWIFARLFKELDIDTIPPAIWGQTPSTRWDILITEFYVTQAKDLWNTPEVKSFLQQTIKGLHTIPSEPLHNNADITLDEARFFILTEERHLIGLVPSGMTSRLNSMSDPLPPDDDLRSYELRVLNVQARNSETSDSRFNEISVERQLRDRPSHFIWELYYLQSFFERIVPNFNAQMNQPVPSNDQHDPLVETLDQSIINDMGITREEISSRLTRLFELRRALQEEPNSTLTTSDGDEAELMADGSVRIMNQGRLVEFESPGSPDSLGEELREIREYMDGERERSS